MVLLFYDLWLYGPQSLGTLQGTENKRKKLLILDIQIELQNYGQGSKHNRLDYIILCVLYTEKEPTMPKSVLLKACFYKQFQIYTQHGKTSTDIECCPRLVTLPVQLRGNYQPWKEYIQPALSLVNYLYMYVIRNQPMWCFYYRYVCDFI